MKWPVTTCLALAGCQAAQTLGTPIACGPAGRPLDSQCSLERRTDSLILHRDDGGFRRMAIGAAGLATSDGAEAVALTPVDGGVEATVGGWTYLIPTAK